MRKINFVIPQVGFACSLVVYRFGDFVSRVTIGFLYPEPISSSFLLLSLCSFIRLYCSRELEHLATTSLPSSVSDGKMEVIRDCINMLSSHVTHVRRGLDTVYEDPETCGTIKAMK